MSGALNPCGKRLAPARGLLGSARNAACFLVALMASVYGCAETKPEETIAFTPQPPPAEVAPPPLASVAIVPAGDQPAFASVWIVKGAGERARVRCRQGRPLRCVSRNVILARAQATPRSPPSASC